MNKVYACSDLHGMYDLWKQIRDYCDETDTIYCLGDSIDRGADGVKILIELLKDKRVKMIKGNHEDILTICVSEFLEGHYENQSWWYSNGGQPTWNELKKINDYDLNYYINKINNLPDHTYYISTKGHQVFLSHAGTDLRYSKSDPVLMTRAYNDPYLWDRKHFHAPHPQNMDNVYQVHGHTPVQSLAKTLDIPMDNDNVKAIYYCDGHKIDIDMGSYVSKTAALIDLDDLNNIVYFKSRS